MSPKTIGKGGKRLAENIHYIRTSNGARIYYEEFVDEVKILGIANRKSNVKDVLKVLAEIYHLDINN